MPASAQRWLNASAVYWLNAAVGMQYHALGAARATSSAISSADCTRSTV